MAQGIGVRKYLPPRRLVVSIVVTLLLLAGDLAAAETFAEASGMFMGGFLFVYFVGGWVYGKVRGLFNSRSEGGVPE